MREFVLNEACLENGVWTTEEASATVADVELGLSELIAAGHALNAMRLAKSVSEIQITPTVSLYDILIALIKKTRTSGRLLSRIATKYPVENDLIDAEMVALVDWRLTSYPDCLSLMLCVCSDRILVTLSIDPIWTNDPLMLDLLKDPKKSEELTSVGINNVFSAANASLMAQKLSAAQTKQASPVELWRDRSRYFSNLDFAPRVEKDLRVLSEEMFSAAVERLSELDKTGAGWNGEGQPSYASRVTGESAPTMQEYGLYRVFRSVSGRDETFELHARLFGGFRLHLRENRLSKRLEIGYIGPHLPTVRFT